jgi:hypothetical protein
MLTAQQKAVEIIATEMQIVLVPLEEPRGARDQKYLTVSFTIGT